MSKLQRKEGVEDIRREQNQVVLDLVNRGAQLLSTIKDEDQPNDLRCAAVRELQSMLRDIQLEEGASDGEGHGDSEE